MTPFGGDFVYAVVGAFMALFIGSIFIRAQKANIDRLIHQYRRRKLGTRGIRAPAKVVDVTPVDRDLLLGLEQMPLHRPREDAVCYRVLVMIHAPEIDPFAGDFYRFLSEDEMMAIRPDAEIYVRFDPTDMDIVELDAAWRSDAIELGDGAR
ncbi:MAG: hypothetical protein KC486_08845 [Myxococcales bacterium]|nr:hypothetical protein [Myxococcales bacterium]